MSGRLLIGIRVERQVPALSLNRSSWTLNRSSRASLQTLAWDFGSSVLMIASTACRHRAFSRCLSARRPWATCPRACRPSALRTIADPRRRWPTGSALFEVAVVGLDLRLGDEGPGFRRFPWQSRSGLCSWPTPRPWPRSCGIEQVFLIRGAEIFHLAGFGHCIVDGFERGGERLPFRIPPGLDELPVQIVERRLACEHGRGTQTTSAEAGPDGAAVTSPNAGSERETHNLPVVAHEECRFA